MANPFRRAYKRLRFETKRCLLANRYYNWYVFSRELTRIWDEKLQKHYPVKEEQLGANAQHKKEERKLVITICNGWIENGGWADRLKGILSTYMLCQEMGADFRVHFVHPFNLDRFLAPNTYDWYIKETEIHYSQPAATPVALEIGADSPYQAKKQKQWLKERIERAQGTQVHVYTNAMFSYLGDYSKAFHELFRPTDELQKAIDNQIQVLGDKYVSVSARFLGALGDFQDTTQGEQLPDKEKERLIDACIKQIEHIHSIHPTQKILVNSDSHTFLSYADKLPYTYIVAGNILHFDTSRNDIAEEKIYQTYEKTFLDFFLIANASDIYRLKTRWMHSSGFPYAASLINHRRFHSIKFQL